MLGKKKRLSCGELFSLLDLVESLEETHSQTRICVHFLELTKED